MPEVKTQDRVYLFQTSNILINTRINLLRNLLFARDDNIRDMSHIMNLVGRIQEKLRHAFTFLIINKLLVVWNFLGCVSSLVEKVISFICYD